MDSTLTGPLGEFLGTEEAALKLQPHLCIVWSRGEPLRVGEVAAVTRSCLLGRGSLQPQDDLARLEFCQQRPGSNTPTGALADNYLSRQQLSLLPQGDALQVKNRGRRRLLINGQPAASGTVRPGDTLHVEGVLVLLVTSRPRILPRPLAELPTDFAFGGADADGLIGESPIAWRLRGELLQAARSRAHVLLQGPSGAGKELGAQVVHRASERRGKLIARNAATIPDSLIDAELFGVAKNYPNAGSPEREGLIGAADGGTLFLDEIGELPEALQAHLLRVLDRGGEYQRLGETQLRKSDLRLVAATNRDPGALKQDLLARFSLRIHVPGLEQRRADIPLLARAQFQHMVAEDPEVGKRFGETHEGVSCPRLSASLMERLTRHGFANNTRELERLLRTAILSSADDTLTVTERVVQAMLESRANTDTSGPNEGIGRETLELALDGAGGSVTKAARQLGLSRFALYRLMKKFDLKSARDEPSPSP